VYGDRTTRLSPSWPGVQLTVVDGACTQWWDQVALPRRLGRDAVDILLSPYYKGPLVAPCPVVVTIHDLFFIGYPGRPRPVRRAALLAAARLYARRAAAIVTDSEHSKRAIVSRLGIAPDKVSTIPVGLGPEFVPTPLSEAIRGRYGLTGPYILYVGNFRPHKNLPRLIAAYARLAAPVRERHRLVLAGGDRSGHAAVMAVAQELGVGDRLTCPGPIADADLPALYSGAALFVLPSLEEGFGLPALEALACGAVVVASSAGALPEVVGKAALLVDPEDEPALVTAMTRALSEPGLRQALRAEAATHARAFTPDRTAGRVLALLHQVARPPATRRTTP
jgi:alpha-1,3-rhamnosyl/mannosyltransferase